MSLLLDTHALLWWLGNPELLSTQSKRAIADGNNVVFVSAAVIWEIVIKKSLGKLESPDDVEGALTANGFAHLAVTLRHALAVEALPNVHRDPFDRMLVAQAISDRLTIVTRDPNIMKYPAPYMVA